VCAACLCVCVCSVTENDIKGGKRGCKEGEVGGMLLPMRA